MKTMIQAAVATLFAASTAHAQQAVQWRVEDGGNGHWYKVVSSGLAEGAESNWEVLDSISRQSGGNLCSVASAAENSFVRSLVTSFNSSSGFFAYLGATQISDVPCGPSGWQWNDGSSWNFTNWQPQQPDCLIGSCSACNETRIAMRSSTGQWGDWNERALNAAVIEWSADCNGDGIVDYGQCRDGSLPDYNGNNIPDCCESESPCTPNIIVNGSFETGASQVCNQNCVGGLAGWSSGSGCDIDWVRIGGCSTPCEVAWPPPDGTAFVDLSGSTGTHGSLWQNVQLEPGRPYRLSFVAGGNCSGDATMKRLRVQVGPLVREYEIACEGNSCWKWEVPDHVDFVAVEVSTQIRFTSVAPGNPNHGPTIDDVSLRPWPPPCPGDLLEDGVVNGADLGILLSQWGPNTPLTGSDLNADGVVNGADLGMLLFFWGACP